MKYFTLVIAFALASPAWGIITSPVTARPGLESDCRILSYNSDGSLESICSGSLRNNREVVTAAHCVNDAKVKPIRFQVECGANALTVPAPAPQFATTAAGGRVLLNGQTFRERLEGTTARISRTYTAARFANDFAVIQLRTPARRVRPTPMASSAEMARFFSINPLNPEISACSLQPGVECQMSGFGVSNAGYAGNFGSGNITCDAERNANLQRSVILVGGLSQGQLEEIGQCLQQNSHNKSVISSFIRNSLAAVASTLNEAVMQPGDSGGAFFCREGAGPWKQVAINSSIDLGGARGRYGFYFSMDQMWSRLDDSQLIPISQWEDPTPLPAPALP